MQSCVLTAVKVVDMTSFPTLRNSIHHLSHAVMLSGNELSAGCRPATSAGRDFVVENIIDSTGKPAANSDARRQRQAAEQWQKERWEP